MDWRRLSRNHRNSPAPRVGPPHARGENCRGRAERVHPPNCRHAPDPPGYPGRFALGAPSLHNSGVGGHHRPVSDALSRASRLPCPNHEILSALQSERSAWLLPSTVGSFEELPCLPCGTVRSTASSRLFSSSPTAPPPADRLDRKESNSVRRVTRASTEAWGSPAENPAQAAASVIQTGIAPIAPSGKTQWRYSPSGRETRRSHSRETP